MLLIDYKRDDRKDLFVIREQLDSGLQVEYPGQLFTERIMDAIQNVFFIRVQEAEGGTETRFVLGAYFSLGQQSYGAYYEDGTSAMELVFFHIEPGDDVKVVELAEDEYRRVAQEFATTYAGMLDLSTGSGTE